MPKSSKPHHLHGDGPNDKPKPKPDETPVKVRKDPKPVDPGVVSDPDVKGYDVTNNEDD